MMLLCDKNRIFNPNMLLSGKNQSFNQNMFFNPKMLLLCKSTVLQARNASLR
jgi:hypothetical protein